MMSQQYQFHVDRAHLYDEVWFENVFQALDQLHDDMSLGCLQTVSPLAAAEMVGWLEDIIYTARETISEIQANLGN
jgi:hypothetical protein